MIDLKSFLLGKKQGGESSVEVQKQSKTVELSMADGNQTVVPDDGYLLSEVTINKPDTLIPENIAEGIDIGGVIGSLVAGGGANVKVASGVTTSYGVTQIEHNLGVVPDIVILGCNTTGNYLRTAWGISSSLNALLNINSFMQMFTYVSSGTTTTSFVKSSITSTSTSNLINNANETTFNLSTSKASNASNTYWVVIGGLT